MDHTTAGGLAGVCTSSVTTSVVMSDSMTPTSMSRTPCTTMVPAAPGALILDKSYWRSMKNGMGNWDSSVNSATSPMVSVRKPTGRTMPNSMTTAATMDRRDEGISVE